MVVVAVMVVVATALFELHTELHNYPYSHPFHFHPSSCTTTTAERTTGAEAVQRGRVDPVVSVKAEIAVPKIVSQEKHHVWTASYAGLCGGHC